MNNELIRLKEISRITTLSTATLRTYIKKGILKGILLGGNYYIRPNDYLEFMFNLECKRLGITSDEAKKLLQEEQEKGV